MSLSSSLERDALILLHAPVGRDARLLQELLQRADLQAQACSSMLDLCQEIERGAGAVFLAEEALEGREIERLSSVLEAQPPWSDLPLIVLTVRGEPTSITRTRLGRLEPLGGLTLLERPLRSDTIISAARSALRARAKQYEVRRRDAEIQLVTDNVPVLISYVDAGQVFRRVNQTYVQWFGKQPEEIVGKTISELVGDPHYSRAAPYIARALRGEPVNFESQLWKGQELRDIDVSYAPDITPDGTVRGFVALVQDITERKRTERQNAFLVRLDDVTRPLTEAAEITQMAARLLGDFLGVNRCAYADVEPDGDTFNLTGDYNRDVPSIVGRYQFRQFGEECLRLMREGEPYVVTDAETDPRTEGVRESYRLTRIVSVICVSLRKQGRFVASMAVHQITPRQWRPDEVELVQQVANRCWESIERARVARELRESEEQFRTLAETIRNLAWMAHADGHVFWYNLRWYEYTGSTAEEMEGWGWQRVHDPEILPQVMERWQASLRTGTPFEMVFPLKSADGRFRPFLTRAEPVRDSQGKITRWFGTSTDIAEQQSTAEELRRMNRGLEEFAYVASHDLQEPLRMVNSYSQLLLRRMGPQASEEMKEFAGYVTTGVKRMEALIHDLLAYSRVTHIDGELSLDRADLSVALQRAISAVSTRIEENQAEVTVGPLPVVAGDEGQLTHVFQNLLSNALKYRKKCEPPRIRIQAERKNDRWVVSVQDNGIGFRQEQSERIFGLFKRLHRADEYPGTGLGLAICKRIVERYRGEIWAESKEEVGSTFYIALLDPPEG